MTHGQTVFLVHWIIGAIVFQIHMEFYAWKRKKARQALHRKMSRKEKSFDASISNLERKVNYERVQGL